MSKNKPRVSIGLPVYNGEPFLREAIDSILAQTFTDFELIISDNASTDNTEEICRSYAAKDSRIRYYRHDVNRGASWNFNLVVDLAVGEYFKWAAHDDVCAPTFLERCVEVLDHDSGTVLSCSQTMFTKSDGRKWWNAKTSPQLSSQKPEERFQGVLTYFWCLEVFGLIRTDVLRKTSRIAPYYGSDRLLLVELSLIGRFQEIPECLFFRRCHAEQSSRLSASEREAWIDPKAVQRSKLLRPRSSIGYIQAVLKSPLNWSERLRCFAVIRDYLFSSKNWNTFFKKKVPTKV